MSDYQFACFVPGIPRPKGSKRYVGHRLNKKGKRVPVLVEQSERLRGWREALCEALAIYGRVQGIREPMTGPIGFYFGFLFPHTKKEKGGWHTVQPDWDKLVRAVGDELKNAGIISDDAILCMCDGGFKRRCMLTETPGVFVKLRMIAGSELLEIQREPMA